MTGNILIVDDDAKVLDIVAQSLASKGHSVRKAAGGREALTTCETDIPDVVLLDLMLPDMDGRDVLRAIRARPGGRTVPVLFLSANADPDTRVNPIDEGAEDFLVKPFSLKELNAKIDRALDRNGSSRVWEAEKTVLQNRIDIQDKNTVVITLGGGCTEAAVMAMYGIVSGETLRAGGMDLDEAIRIAVAVWEPIYGEQQIAKQKPYKATLTNGVWTVEGSLPGAMVGGVAVAEIMKEDGRILRVSHGR